MGNICLLGQGGSILILRLNAASDNADHQTFQICYSNPISMLRWRVDFDRSVMNLKITIHMEIA